MYPNVILPLDMLSKLLKAIRHTSASLAEFNPMLRRKAEEPLALSYSKMSGKTLYYVKGTETNRRI
jgi:hypothetical protein